MKNIFAKTKLCRNSLLLAVLIVPFTLQNAAAQSAGDGAAAAEVSAAEKILQTLATDGPAKALTLFDTSSEAVEADPFNVRYSPAAGGVNRALAQLSSDEQYEILAAWTLPKETSDVRVLTAIVPEIAPPQEFARAIGERPKKESFAVASIGDVRGLYCSAWMLITAADDAGQLRKLITDLEARVAKKGANAEFVLSLAQLRESRTTADELKKLINARTNLDSATAILRMENAVILAAAIQRPELASACEPLADQLVTFDFSKGVGPWISFLRRLRGTAILKSRSPDTDPNAILRETPSLWIAAADQRNSELATGSDQALWLTHELHVQRLAGVGDDLLLFRYPLSGSFELKGEVSAFEHGATGMTYGGLSFDANEKLFSVREATRPVAETRNWPFIAPKELRMFNRLNIRSDGEKVLFLSNLHPGASIPAALCASSPWLGLQASGFGRLYYRNLEIVGEPTIPREVALIGTSDLRGWTTPLGESMPRSVQPLLATTVSDSPVKQPALDWFLSGEAEVQSQKRTEPMRDSVAARQLSNIRPLLEGETLSYEYFYEDKASDVSPSLGRMAFLLEPGGVRIRWVTSGASDWTGLKSDNAVIEPLNRKGPRNLPLKAADWNSVSLQRQDGKVRITLNGELVYERGVSDLVGMQPGFYHDANQSSARIRKVILSGGTTWPEKLTADQMSDPVAMNKE